MNGLYSLLIALSMYSRIPVPVIKWSRERMGYVMCWFPIVGILIGIFLIIWIKVAEILKFGPEITGIVGVILPILITGGIHMDGFLDTWDALSSWGERERKLEILKDSHVGAFGVIACAVYLLYRVLIEAVAVLPCRDKAHDVRPEAVQIPRHYSAGAHPVRIVVPKNANFFISLHRSVNQACRLLHTGIAGGIGKGRVSDGRRPCRQHRAGRALRPAFRF